MRKAQLYLHPDNRPADLTESQALVFMYIWDILKQAEDMIPVWYR